MRVLITGSAGFIGSALSLRLLERGDEVIGVDCLDPYYDVTLKEARLARTRDHASYTDVRARIEDRAAMTETFARYQPQRVINLAAQAGVRYSIENPDAYVGGWYAVEPRTGSMIVFEGHVPHDSTYFEGEERMCIPVLCSLDLPNSHCKAGLSEILAHQAQGGSHGL